MATSKQKKQHGGSKSRLKFTLLLLTTVIASLLALGAYCYLPFLIGQTIWNQLSISPESGSFQGWRLNPVPIIDRFYLYNITNYEEISEILSNKQTNNTVALVLQEVGPFAYRQEREKMNITFENDTRLVGYDQFKRWYHIPDLTTTTTTTTTSAASPFSLPIYHVSLPLVGTTVNTEMATLADGYITENNLQLFRQHNVSELMFEGYEDELITLAKEAGQVEIDRFGWMYNQNDTSSGRMKIITGVGGNYDTFGQVQEFNDMSELGVWSPLNTNNNNSCNQFTHASAGDMYPPGEKSFVRGGGGGGDESEVSITQIKSSQNVSNKQKSIYLFLSDLCRTFELVYNKTLDYNGLLVDRYIANERTFDYTSDESKRCFCLEQSQTTDNSQQTITSCPPNGMMDLHSCRKGSPLTVSFPYFLYSDQDKTLEPYMNNKIRYAADSQKRPTFEEHGFYLDLEASLNVPVRAQVSLQFNLHYKPVVNKLTFTNKYTSIFRPFSQNESGDYYIPQMWFSSRVQLDDETHIRLRVLQNYITKVAPIATALLSLIALALLITCLAIAITMRLEHNRTCKKKTKKKSTLETHKRAYEQLRKDEPIQDMQSDVYQSTTITLP